MNSLIESLGLLCIAIQEGGDHEVGRTKLQKMIYFADRYLEWDVGDYDLHYYGPYSQNISSTLKTAREILINENRPEFGPYHYELTQEGIQFVGDFENNVCDEEKTEKTRKLFRELSQWSKDELELSSTLDYVSKNIPDIGKEDLIEQVSIIKENFPLEQIENVYELWSEWRDRNNFN